MNPQKAERAFEEADRNIRVKELQHCRSLSITSAC